MDNRYTFKYPNGLIYSGKTWKSKIDVIIALCEGRPIFLWGILYLQGWKIINEPDQ